MLSSVVFCLVACGLFHNSVQEDMITVKACNTQYPAKMSCDSSQVVNIVSAFYGRADASTCPGGDVSNTNCQQAFTTGSVIQKCNGKSSCQFTPNDSAGDPCSGIAKYLVITYSCADPWNQELCENDPAQHLRCEGDQLIRVMSAFFGRSDSTTCPNGVTTDTNCKQDSATKTVKGICETNTPGGYDCLVNPTTAVFGDPCVNTYKYMQLKYYCTGAQRTIACENSDPVNIWCNGAREVNILNAFWGRGDSNICPGGNSANTNCARASATSTVYKACQGQRGCTINPNNGQFGGDPCSGTYKYLVIDWFCKVVRSSAAAIS